MFDKIVMAKLEGAQATAAAKAAAGKSFMIAKVSNVGNIVILKPVGSVAGKAAMVKAAGTGAGMGAGSLALKLEGAKEAMGLKAMVGKTITIGKGPMAGGKWLVLKPVAAASVKTAAVGAGLALSKVEGAKQVTQVKGLVGHTYTVVDPATAGQAGKSVLVLKPAGAGAKAAAAKSMMAKTTIAKTTMAKAAGAGVAAGAAETEGAAALKGGAALKGMAAKAAGAAELEGAAAKAAVMKGAGAKGVASKGLITIDLAGKQQAMAYKSFIGKKVTVDMPLMAGKGTTGNWLALKAAPSVGAKTATGAVAAGTKAMTAPKIALAAKGAGVATGAATGGTIWTGTGWSLGLGLGLGGLGPILLGSAALGASYAVYKKMKTKNEKAKAAEDDGFAQAFLDAIGGTK